MEFLVAILALVVLRCFPMLFALLLPLAMIAVALALCYVLSFFNYAY